MTFAEFIAKLQLANLPLISATEDGKISMGPMTEGQEEVYRNIRMEFYQPVLYQRKLDDELRLSNLSAFLISSGLAGRNLSTVNNNTDRDALLKVICFQLGLCDSGGVIYPHNQFPQSNPNSSPQK